jgi:hypothetical protein
MPPVGKSRKAVRRLQAPQRNRRNLPKPKRYRPKALVMVRSCARCGGEHPLGDCPVTDAA